MRVVWPAVAVIVALALGVLLARAETSWGGWRTVELPRPEEAPVIVIGSSLMGTVLGSLPEGETLLGDGRAHALYWEEAITEIETMLLFEQAVANRTPTIVIEAMDFALTSRKPGSPEATTALMAVDLISLTLQQKLKRGLKVFPSAQKSPRPGHVWHEAFEPAAPTPGTIPEIRRWPGLEPDWLAHALGDARRAGLDVILVIPPLSASAVAQTEPDGGRTLMASVAASLARFEGEGVRVWVPDAAWPDTLFGDPVHVSEEGGAAVIQVLRDWYRARP
ncbi:MAG: hypothetical protein AAF371_10005 [Pseudomonadota bacterium]